MFQISHVFIDAIGSLSEDDRNTVEEIKQHKQIDDELHSLFADRHNNVFTASTLSYGRERISDTIDIVIQAYALAKTPHDVSRLSQLGIHLGRYHRHAAFAVTKELQVLLRDVIHTVHEKLSISAGKGSRALERRKVAAICAKLEEIMNRVQ